MTHMEPSPRPVPGFAPSPDLSQPSVQASSQSSRAVYGRKVEAEAVVLREQGINHFPREVFYPAPRKAGERTRPGKTPSKQKHSKSPSSAPAPQAALKKPTSRAESHRKSAKGPKVHVSAKPVSGTSSKSAEKVTSEEMMRYLEDIPKILQAREERKAAWPEAVKSGMRKEREKRGLEEALLKGEIQRRKEEIARNNQKIRQINKIHSHKRSFPSENAASNVPSRRVDHRRESSEARKRPNPRSDRTPPSAQKQRSLSEEKVRPEDLVEYMERRKVVLKEGKHMAQLYRKAEEGKRLSQLKELDKMQRERLADYKRGKKKEIKGKKRTKKTQKRTKSSEVLPWEGSPGLDQVHSSSPNLLKEDAQEFSLYQREIDLPDSQPDFEKAKPPPFFFSDFLHSPKPQQFAGFRPLEPEEVAVLPGPRDSKPDTSTADFPVPIEDSGQRKMEIRRKLADLRVKSEGGNREESSREGPCSAVWLVRSIELKQMIREEAATKIQSHVRRYLTQKRLEGLFTSSQRDVDRDESLPDLQERVSSDITAQASQSSARLTLQQFEERLRLEQATIAKATEDEIALLRAQNRKLAEEQKKAIVQVSEDDYLQMLHTAKQQEMQQFQELLQTKCGSRVDLVEEMSMAFEGMLEVRYRQLVLLFSQNRERIQAALKSTPSDLDISSTFTHVSGPQKEEIRPVEEEQAAVETSNPQDTSLDAFLRKALGTEEATKIETEAANQAASILEEAKRQAQSEYSHFDPYAERPQNPFPELSDEESGEAFVSPDLSVIQMAQESFEGEGLVPVKRRSRPSDPEKVLSIQLVVGGESSQEPIWHIASPEPDDGIRSGTEQFPYRVVGTVTRGTDEPTRPAISPPPVSFLDSSSSEGLEDLLSRPHYQQPKAPLKPQPPKPRPPVSDQQSQGFEEVYHNLVHQVITESLTTVPYPHSDLRKAGTGLDSNPFEDTSSAEREAMSHEDLQGSYGPSESQVAGIVDDLLKKLLVESFPKLKVLPELPRLNFPQMDSLSQPESLYQQSERLERFGPGHISDYVSLVFSTISESRLKSALEVPIVLDPILVLGLMQDIEQGPLVTVDLHRYPILPIDVYLQLDEYKETTSRSEMTPSTKDIIRDSKRYQNRLLFDAANELLQNYRLYGVKGTALPWSKATRALTPHPASISALQTLVCTELITWSGFEVGKIPEGPLLTSTGQVNEQHLQMIREEKLSKMLTKEIMENDQMWTDYEAEDAQVKIDLADMILEQLMDEMEAFLQGLR